MPLPSPKDDESHDEWIDRCMSNDTMKDEYDDIDQRYAVCQRIWEDEKEEDSKTMNKKERRHVSFDKLEIRADENGDGPGTLKGYSAVFNSETVIGDWFRERVEPGAFAEAIEKDNVRGLYNHNPDHILGTTEAGTLRLEEDEHGLRMEVDLPDTPIGNALQTSVERGDITGQSFGFFVSEQRWEEKEDELDLRVIEKVSKLEDVGPVTFPAYEDTEVGVAKRQYRSWKQGRQNDEGEWHGITYSSAHESVETADPDAEWDANAAMTEADEDDYHMMCAMERGEGGNREDYKLPHHFPDGRAVKSAVDNAMARLPQVEGVPAAAKDTARAHLEKHQTDDFDEDEENTGRPASVMRKRLELIKLNAPR